MDDVDLYKEEKKVRIEGSQMKEKKKDQISKEEVKKIWMSCRGKEGCIGLYAEKVNDVVIPLDPNGNLPGGRVVRFRCLTCRSIWSLPLVGEI